MKKWFFLVLSLCLLLLLFKVGPANSPASISPSNPWQLLTQQSADLAASIRQQRTHSLHQLDAAIGKETVELLSAGAALPEDKRKFYADELKKLADLAHGIHVDAHHGSWDQATLKQAEFAATLQKTEALLSGKN